MGTRLLAIGPALLAAAMLSPAQAPKVLTLDDIFQYRIPSDPQLSPDGTQILYVTSIRDLKENTQNTDIWKVSAAGGTAVQLTRNPKSDQSPRWSPDGNRIAFLSDRSGKNQIYLMDAAGGEPEALTGQKDGIISFAWSPDGKRMAFTALEPRSEEEEKQISERWLPRVVDQDLRYAALWVLDLESRKPVQITRGKLHVNTFDWSPDGASIAFSAPTTPDLEESDTADVYVVPAGGGEIRRLSSFTSGDNNPRWSPDGQRIVFASRGNARSGAVNTHLYEIAAGGGTARDLTAGFDESPAFAAWSPENDTIYFSATVKAYRHLFALPAKQVTAGNRVYSGFSFDRRCRNVAFIRESGSEPPEIYFAQDLAFERARRLTDINPQLRGVALGRQEVVHWRNSSGQEIEGILVKPVGYQEGKRYPLLLVIHGGPAGVDLDNFSLVKSAYPVQVFAGRGYAVLMPNYRGSTGYGEKWRQGNVGSLGANEFDDINSGIDELIRRGLADPDRLGFMGWSYGGHMTYYAVTHSSRFKAASAGAGATNMVSMYAQTDLPGFYSKTYFGFPPWENFDFYIEHSSFYRVRDARTPILMQYGERDARVPLPQGFEFYRAMKELGVPCQLVIYPGQGHGITEPRYQKDLMQRNLDWFERWIR